MPLTCAKCLKGNKTKFKRQPNARSLKEKISAHTKKKKKKRKENKGRSQNVWIPNLHVENVFY